MEEDDDDGVVFLEERNMDSCSANDLPHLRANCLLHKFCAPNFELFCQNCYCYCCDIRVSDCKKWKSHCEATDQGPLKESWKKFKLNEIDQVRILEGRPPKKKKTMLSFFQKADTTLHPAIEPLDIAINKEKMISLNQIVAVEKSDDSITVFAPTKINEEPAVLESISIPTNTKIIESVIVVSEPFIDHSDSKLHITEENITISNKEIHYPTPEKSASLNYVKTQSNQRKSTKNVPEFPWLSAEGLLSFHTGIVLLPQPLDLKRNGRYGKNKFIGCLVCAQYEPTSPWATKQYRTSESRNFLAHEQSDIHRLAEAKSRNEETVVL